MLLVVLKIATEEFSYRQLGKTSKTRKWKKGLIQNFPKTVHEPHTLWRLRR